MRLHFRLSIYALYLHQLKCETALGGGDTYSDYCKCCFFPLPHLCSHLEYRLAPLPFVLFNEYTR